MGIANLSIMSFLQMATVTTLTASPIFEVVFDKQPRASGEPGAMESAT